MKFSGIRAFPTNWTNGMKLSSEHFQHLENSIEDSVTDARSVGLLAGSMYGLLPQSQFTLRNAEGLSGQSVRVILEACQAILPGGARVEIVPAIVKALHVPNQAPFVEFMPNPGERYHLFLTIDEETRIGAGLPETRPIREPYLVYNYQLECIAQNQLAAVQSMATNRMKIGEWKDGKILEGYIPPCLTLEGYPLLDKWHQFFRNQLENSVKISSHVIAENRKKDPSRSEFCERIVEYVRGSQGEYNLLLPTKSPMYFVSYFADFAGMVKGMLETHDRDFVRNVLKNGDINGLNQSLEYFLRLKKIPLDDIANVIVQIKRFIDALMATIQQLVTKGPPAPRMGDRNIASG
ncbi:MAG: hypothetical protein ACI84C_000560 [Flavobacteriales bacterium]|jgi:hypothetical protein